VSENLKDAPVNIEPGAKMIELHFEDNGYGNKKICFRASDR